jgi:hypothetical protein
MLTPNWYTPTLARSASVPRSRSASTTRRAFISSMVLSKLPAAANPPTAAPALRLVLLLALLLGVLLLPD